MTSISARTLQRCDFREKSSVGKSLAISGHASILLPGTMLSRQIEHIVPGNNIEEFPDKRLMTNQQRNIPQNSIFSKIVTAIIASSHKVILGVKNMIS